MFPRLTHAKKALKITILGDSLTAGYGLSTPESFPAKLEAALLAQGTPAKVINAGVSGDTTRGGRSRLGWALADKPDIVVVQLGGNDMLRGIDPKSTRENLDAILKELGDKGVVAIIAGMRAAPNLGPKYVAAFDAIYPALAKKHGVTLYPFFLDGVAMDPALNQSDGIHPNAKGVDELVRRFLPTMTTLVARLAKPGP